jgi:hypothetical protein
MRNILVELHDEKPVQMKLTEGAVCRKHAVLAGDVLDVIGVTDRDGLIALRHTGRVLSK